MSNSVGIRNTAGFRTNRTTRQETANVGGGGEEAVHTGEGEFSISSFLSAIRNQINDYFTNSKDAGYGEAPVEEEAKSDELERIKRCMKNSDLKLNCSKCGTLNSFDFGERNSIWHKAAEELYARRVSEKHSRIWRGDALEPSDSKWPSRKSSQVPSRINDQTNGNNGYSKLGANVKIGLELTEKFINDSQKADTLTNCKDALERNSCKQMQAEPLQSSSCVVSKESDEKKDLQEEPILQVTVPRKESLGLRGENEKNKLPDKTVDRSKLEWKSSSDQQVLQFYKNYQRRNNKRIMNCKDGYRLKLHHLFSLDNQDGVRTERAKILTSKSENEICNIVAKYNHYITKHKLTRESNFADARIAGTMSAKNKERLFGDGGKPNGFRVMEDAALLSKYSGLDANDKYKVSLTCNPAFIKRNKKGEQDRGKLYPNKHIPMFIKCDEDCNSKKRNSSKRGETKGVIEVPVVLVDTEGICSEKKQKKTKGKKKKRKPSVSTCPSSVANTDSCITTDDTASPSSKETDSCCFRCNNAADKCSCEKTTTTMNTESCQTSGANLNAPPFVLTPHHRSTSKCKSACKCGKSSRSSSRRDDNCIRVTTAETDIGFCKRTRLLFCCCCKPD